MQIFMTPIHQSLGPESIEGDCISKSEARDFEKKQAISESMKIYLSKYKIYVRIKCN